MLGDIDIRERKSSNSKNVGEVQYQESSCQQEQSLPHGPRIGDNKAGVKP